MFYLVGFEGKCSMRVYGVGDRIDFIFGNISSVKFRGVIKGISDSGVVTIDEITIKAHNKPDMKIDSVFKLETADIMSYHFERQGLVCNPVAIIDECGVTSKLVAKRSSVEFKEGDSISLDIVTDIGREIYSGVYLGLDADSNIKLNNCEHYEALRILRKGAKETLTLLDRKDVDYISLGKVNKVWYTNDNRHSWHVKVAKSVKQN